MSALKPAKQPRLMGQNQVKATTTLEEKDLHTATTPSPETEAAKTPNHPKGHKVRELEEIWKTMDASSFLHLTDTATLNDVWVQPKSVEPTTGMYATVHFVQIVAAPHIKYREAATKMAVEDLLKMLYLNDCLQCDVQSQPRLGYDEWLAEKTATFIKKHGVDDSTNKAKLCQFVITEDPDYSFYPQCFKNSMGVFFRKICYHSYKSEGNNLSKIINPSMMKCCASRGKFEYMLEARFFPLPDEWWKSEDETVPSTQPLDM